MSEERFDQIMEISPRRFHITASPPYGVGIVFCGQVQTEEESLDELTTQRDGIVNCKPGIWRSAVKEVPPYGTSPPELGPYLECYLYWVCDGAIDLAQPVDEWETYDKESRESDATVNLDSILPKGVKWTRAGSYYDDGGACNVLSTEYLTKDAAKKVMFEDSEEEEELDFEYYLATITLNYQDGKVENSGFTLGGMSFGQDGVGGPPYISVARQNGQAIAIKLHSGTGDEEYDEVDEDSEQANLSTSGAQDEAEEEEEQANPSNSEALDESMASNTASGPEDSASTEPEPTAQKKRKHATELWEEILPLRHSLQQGLLTQDAGPKEEDMKSMSEYMTKLESYDDLDVDTIKTTKINKVLRAILKLESIPKEEDFGFKARSQALLEKWNMNE
ncbi:hypothetical protein BGZ63DRAFT_424812 [Mariannaea sp. PMI_226]|nr:hypothetical protein BGZ63DRAFT_424812 [Mariannaea sp. PMI_226]